MERISVTIDDAQVIQDKLQEIKKLTVAMGAALQALCAEDTE